MGALTYADVAGPAIFALLVLASALLAAAIRLQRRAPWHADRLTDAGTGCAVLALVALVAALLVP